MAVDRLLLLHRPYDQLLISSVIIFLVIFSPMTNSLSEAEVLLKLKNSFTNAQALDSWTPGTVPCTGKTVWKGLVCFNGIVTGIRLGGLGLSGEIDVNTLRELKALRTISFMNNSFSGSIPEFHQVSALKAIYLAGNQFSGEIPADYFAKMDSLKKLWLSDNKFTGNIPSSLSQLPHLIELHLENNQFSGNILDFNIPTLASLNLSNNRLQGKIPDSLSRFNASSFAGNAGLCGEKLGIECSPKAVQLQTSNKNADDHDNNNLNKVIALAITIGVVLLSLIIWFIIKSNRKGDEELDKPAKGNNNVAEETAIVAVHVTTLNKKEVESVKKVAHSSSRKGSIRGKGNSVSGIGELVILNDEKGGFGLPDLMKAAAEVLGNGGSGSSYKAVMANGMAVVVKRMKKMNAKRKDEFDAEIARLGKLRHWNILTPIAYHYRKEEKLLIYEFIPKGSLLYLLHGDRGPSHSELNWSARLKIVQGIAKGLAYLHKEFASSDLPHGNLKSSNVLLGPDYEPLVSDFGFSQLINSANQPQALFAYKSPEAVQSGRVSRKSDVYCLGIVILEILTGKFPCQYLSNGKGGTDVVQWVATAVSEGRGTELLDPEISNSKNSVAEMERLLIVGSACTESDQERRLGLEEAVRRIEEVRIEGVCREMHLQPSLRDGYADSPANALQPQTHTISLKDGFADGVLEFRQFSNSKPSS